MNFEFSDDQKMLRDEARKFLVQQCPVEEVHRVLNGDDQFSKPVWDAVIEMGWTATALPAELGGFGMGYLELCVLAEEVGRASAPIPFSSAVYLAGECLLQAGSDGQKGDLLPKLAAGESLGTLAVVDDAGPGANAATVTNEKLTGSKIVVPDAEIADYAVVLANDGKVDSLFVAALAEPGVSRSRQNTIDPSRSHSKIEFQQVPVARLGQAGQGSEILDAVYDRAAVLFAFEQLGGAQAALDMACQFAKERFAFGRPVGSFQGIKHRLAEMYVSLELARSNCYHGAYALATGAADLPIAAGAARLAAGRAFFECARENTQVHGGMGFSWQGNCHLYYRRAKLLNLALGGERLWKDKLIHRLGRHRDANGGMSAIVSKG
jgi:alkylation response protein AidB-like acyl-CoA dehydrogenase